MPLDATSTSTLATTAMGNLRTYFAERNHYPSDDHWLAIGDVVNTLDSMARGECEPQVYLSALDPGVGKSSAVVAFAAALGGSLEHADVGMIVCVGRITEAESMARAILAQRPTITLAVLTSDNGANKLSTAAPSDAQVLVTTQQRIELATDGRGFEECASFHYRGSPRAVRAWDEAWLPGVTITVAKYDLLRILGVIARHSRECADAVEAFAQKWDSFGDGAPVPVPDFEAQHKVSFQAIRGQSVRDDDRAILGALAALSGRTARMKSDGNRGMRVLTYKDTLPDDLAPLIVLDASGRVRQTYQFIERHRGGLVQLHSAVKNYGPLTVKLWQRSGSKSGWGSGGTEMIDVIVETIREKTDEAWLIVAHKKDNDIPDIDCRIRRKLPKGVNFKTITWGSHMASNDHSETPNVILAGTLFMASSHYTALTHLAQDRDVEHGLASTADVRTTELGEHANLILQAVCRGRVRKSDGDRCLPMTAYIIASAKSGIPSILQVVFPGCSVETWREGKIKTPRLVTKALRFIADRLKAGATSVTTTEIREYLTLDRTNLHSRVLKHPHWALGLKRLQMAPFKSAGRVPGGVRTQ